ncbi:hypothetical protein GW626_19500 [Peribacillus muralis]|uniref:hypothetical protein n=1 Tax=Peribacillus muralis TaxID=264697 RepID=UPI001F4D65B4|nr:hypothetical protein [Peribacillus muralis]MCK1994795.1 hypothetical protein [Peribacillus muralis]MCK2015378.1 hypothetical protein [Peribacillus muralis]
MKRYLCSIIIGLVVLLSIGTYYVKVASSASGLPTYTFKTIEGSDKELDPVRVKAALEQGNFYEEVTIESNQNTYESDRYRSFWSDRYDVQIERLIKKHRSFMRGKDIIDSFYEDDDFLAYASVNNEYTNSGKMEAEFDIGVLEKKDEEQTSFRIDLPHQERVINTEVRDVQLIHSKLQVLTMNDVHSNDDKETREVHLYTIDLAKKKVVNDKTLVSETFTYPNQVDIEMPVNTAPSKPNNLILFSLIKGVNHEQRDYEVKLKESKVFSYQYDTEKLTTVKGAKKESLNLDIARSGYTDGKSLYTIDDKSAKYHLKTFDLSSEVLTNDMELDLVVNKKDQNFVAINNGRVYLLLGNRLDQKENLTNDPAQLLIADVKTGKTLYKGETVRHAADKKNEQKIGFFINNLEVK